MRETGTHKLVLLISILLNFGNHLYAQQKVNDSLIFSGRITDFDNKRIYSKVYLVYDRNDWFNKSDSTSILNNEVSRSGMFKFHLPDLGKPFKIRMTVKNNENKTVWQYFFYAQSGDSIQVNIVQNEKRDLVTFSGRGVEKYKAAVELQNQFNRNYFDELRLIGLDSIKDSEELGFKMNKLASLIGKYKGRKTKYIKELNVNAEIKSILEYEFAPYNNEWAWRTELLYRIHEYREQLGEIYLNHKSDFSEEQDSLGVFFQNYFKHQAYRSMLELAIVTKSDKIQLQSLYNLIKTNYSGIIRDRILGFILLHRITTTKCQPFSSTTIDSLLRDALELVNINYVKKAFKEEIDRVGRINDRKVIETEFLGLNAESIYLKSLKGKVFLIDTWFNGCAGCAGFHKTFKKRIYSKFNHIKNFVVLSVNVDKDKERWKSGIESNLYTSKDYINVTTGNWFDHPFLKYYKVRSSPWLMLVDAEGNIVYQPSGVSMEELTIKISEALNQMTTSSK